MSGLKDAFGQSSVSSEPAVPSSTDRLFRNVWCQIIYDRKGGNKDGRLYLSCHPHSALCCNFWASAWPLTVEVTKTPER